VAVAACYALVKATAARHPDLAADVVLNGGDGAPARRAADELAAAARRRLERRLDCLGFVPDDPSLRAALAAGMPLPDAAAGSPVADHLRAIGSRLLIPAGSPTRPVAARTA
jgi:MinD-like ATPase involved in chromosome partitioning or flagellar assembly